MIPGTIFSSRSERIAWIDSGGHLKVGPQSAGASPGPVCYAKGGRNVTVTDANVALQTLNPRHLLGGRIPIDAAIAREAIAVMAKRLGMSVMDVARGIISVVVANMVRAVSNARVPRIQLVIGPDHGAANYGMCGRAYKPHFLFSTMRARTSVMSGQSAAYVLLTLEKRNRKVRGKEMTPEEEEAFRGRMMEKYEGEAHPFYCAARLLTDGVIRFREIRETLATAFEISLLQPIPKTVLGNFHF